MSLEFIRKFDEDLTHEEIEHFDNWVKDESYFEDYAAYELLRDSEVLMRVYKYVPEDSEEYPLFDENFRALGASKEKILPFAKVIKVGPKPTLALKQGDIISLMEAVGLRKLNPDYLDWKEQRVAQPGFDEEMPPVYIYGLEKLQAHMLVRDKMVGLQENDELTFLLPDGLVRTKMNFDVE